MFKQALQLLWFVALILAMAACDTGTHLQLAENTSPPSFSITGDEAVSVFWVRGPLSSKTDGGAPPIVWHIVPVNSNPLPNEIPPIVFGTVPKDWRQESPISGKVVLEEGQLYRATVVTTRNRSANLLFRVENGSGVKVNHEP